jgi:hypothetical protein
MSPFRLPCIRIFYDTTNDCCRNCFGRQRAKTELHPVSRIRTGFNATLDPYPTSYFNANSGPVFATKIEISHFPIPFIHFLPKNLNLQCCGSGPAFTPLRIQIQIRIQGAKQTRIHADLDPGQTSQSEQNNFYIKNRYWKLGIGPKTYLRRCNSLFERQDTRFLC